MVAVPAEPSLVEAVPGAVIKAAWRPDPTGRHELRYWDGNAWTDDVADDGVAATDPFRSYSKWSLALFVGATALAVLAVVVFYRSNPGERTGLGSSMDDIADPAVPAIHRLTLEANQVLLITVESKQTAAAPSIKVVIDTELSDRIAARFPDFSGTVLHESTATGTTLRQAVPIAVSGEYQVLVSLPTAGSCRLALEARPFLDLNGATSYADLEQMVSDASDLFLR